VLDTLTLERLYFDMISRSTHPTLALSWRHQKEDRESRLFYLGASVWECEESGEILAHLTKADAVILAEHGPVIKTGYEIDSWEKEPVLVVIASNDAIAAPSPNRATEIALSSAEILAPDRPICIELP
jgi:hypothetical protein